MPKQREEASVVYMNATMAIRRVLAAASLGLIAVLAVATPTLAQADPPYFAGADPSGSITVTSPTKGASYAAYPTGDYGFPDRSGTFSPALFEESADLVTVRWQATGVSGDVIVKIVMDGETVDTGIVAASTGSYTWLPAVEYGQTYSHYANCHVTVASVADPAVEGASAVFAVIPWGAVVLEWKGLKVYSNFPRPNWIAPGVSSIPVFGDSGAGFRYQCDELAQRWTTQTEHWQDKNGNALPDHWAGSSAKNMLKIAGETYGLPTVANDHTATSPPDPGDLLVWGSGQYGHVAVVGAVEGDRLRIYEQNGASGLEGTRTLALERSSGKVWVDQEGVIGWIKPLQRHTFADIDPSPYRQAIEDLAQAGIVSGYLDGTFRPQAPVIRQQFAKMIVKTLDLPVSGTELCPFVDVTAQTGTDPFYPSKYVAVCAANEITQGKSPDTFAPYDDITRQQLITMIVRAAILPDAPSYYAPPFSLAQFYPEEHYQNARRAAYVGLLNKIEGVGEDFDFFSSATRGEVAGMLYNLLNHLAPGND